MCHYKNTRTHSLLVCVCMLSALSATNLSYADSPPAERKNPCANSAGVDFYPNALKRSGVVGKVLVELTLDERGCVKTAKMLKTDSKKLSQPAIAYAKTFHIPKPEDFGSESGQSVFVTIDFKMAKFGQKCILDSKPVPPSTTVMSICGQFF